MVEDGLPDGPVPAYADVSKGASWLSCCDNTSMVTSSDPSYSCFSLLSKQQMTIDFASFKKLRFLVVYFLSQLNK